MTDNFESGVRAAIDIVNVRLAFYEKQSFEDSMKQKAELLKNIVNDLADMMKRGE